MKALITGGSGFIGSFLAEKIHLSSEVTVLDNLSTGTEENLRNVSNNVKFINDSIASFKLRSKYELLLKHLFSILLKLT